ncbi:MAG: VOC family protein [Pseudomonadota bacterium]
MTASDGHSIWTDLSTLRPDITQAFYSTVLGWDFNRDDYAIAHQDGQPTAALYSMPEFFRSINMPSFWMPYFSVTDVDAAVDKAKALGAKVEIAPEPLGAGRFALVRDPLGAGFSLFEGSDFDNRYLGAGGRIGQSLFVSDAGPAMSFYSALFDWSFREITSGIYSIQKAWTQIGHMHVLPEATDHDGKEFWAILFRTKEPKSKSEIENAGGTVLLETDLPESRAKACYDPDGAYFLLFD